MSGVPDQAARRLALAENGDSSPEAAQWIGPLVALGATLARHLGKFAGRQLVVVVSVPRRDFAAALIGCGWVLNSVPPQLEPPIDVLRGLERNTPIRVVTEQYVMTGRFLSLNESVNPPRVQFGSSSWQLDRFKAVTILAELDTPERGDLPDLGSIGDLARLAETWAARLARPKANLAIVGTKAWLEEDVEAWLSRDGAMPSAPNPISDLLLPKTKRAATWFTRFYPSAGFAEQLPLSTDLDAVLLDGSGAIKYLAEIVAPIVVCIVDRSISDETAGDLVVQLRNTRGEPVSLGEGLHWRPPEGVESLAFTVAL
jgi:hypothetical protein